MHSEERTTTIRRKAAKFEARTSFGSIALGATFVYREVEILGPAYADSRKPPFEGDVLTVVGFKPRYINNIVVRDSKGNVSLMPAYMVETALALKASQPGA